MSYLLSRSIGSMLPGVCQGCIWLKNFCAGYPQKLWITLWLSYVLYV